MLKVVTAEQMRRIDETTIRERGIAGRELMERAGREAAREVIERFSPQSVAVVTGKGNNGGDGFVAARHLIQAGIPTVVFALFTGEELKGDARSAFDDLPDSVPVQTLGPDSVQNLAASLREFDIVIDAIFGTGLKGPATGVAARAIEAINGCGLPVVSLDMPSGLSSDGRTIEGPIVRAAVTITMGLPKIGLVMDPGIRFSGTVSMVDPGFPSDLLNDDSITCNLMTPEDAAALLPARKPSGHKGTFGRVLILAGGEGMTGAAVLAARAASRSGVGLVFAAYPRALGDIMESHLIEPVKRPLAGRERWFVSTQAASALAEAEGAQAVALGPGIGRRSETGLFTAEIIRGVKAPLALDADALNYLATNLKLLFERPGPTILTPHPGEAARLLQTTIGEVESNRLEACLSLSHEYSVIVVLKGAQTIITSPDGQRYINPSGNSGLSKGGSGDVLTGLIAGLLAQGCPPLGAAQLGVFLHGLAADRAARKIGVRAMTPSDVVDHLGEAFLFLERGES